MAQLSFFNVDAAVSYAHDHLRERRHKFRAQGLDDPVDWLDPATLSEIVGLSHEIVPSIHLEGRPVRDAPVGLLDVVRRHVLVSEELGFEVARFTGAHEIAHYLLHWRGFKQHYERAFDSTMRRSRREEEADQFAARFLMPKRLLIRRLGKNFCEPPIRIDDNWLYFLLGDQTDPDSKELNLEYALATKNRNRANEQITSLHQQFKVSKKAMAIRLREIRALIYPVMSYRTDL